jgi:hypothetical protein
MGPWNTDPDGELDGGSDRLSRPGDLPHSENGFSMLRVKARAGMHRSDIADEHSPNNVKRHGTTARTPAENPGFST